MLGSLLAFPSITIHLPQWFPIISAVIALAALSIAFLNYRRKSGLKIRGSFEIAPAGRTNDAYVSEVILDNLKDRSVGIYSIYLRVGWNYYIELADHIGAPVQLKAYESYKATFHKIEAYSSIIDIVTFKKLLEDSSVKKRLVLSTSHGKYTVPKPLNAWTPYSERKLNSLTEPVKPVQGLDQNGVKELPRKEAELTSWFQYYIVGPALTRYLKKIMNEKFLKQISE